MIGSGCERPHPQPDFEDPRQYRTNQSTVPLAVKHTPIELGDVPGAELTSAPFTAAKSVCASLEPEPQVQDTAHSVAIKMLEQVLQSIPLSFGWHVSNP